MIKERYATLLFGWFMIFYVRVLIPALHGKQPANWLRKYYKIVNAYATFKYLHSTPDAYLTEHAHGTRRKLTKSDCEARDTEDIENVNALYTRTENGWKVSALLFYHRLCLCQEQQQFSKRNRKRTIIWSD